MKEIRKEKEKNTDCNKDGKYWFTRIKRKSGGGIDGRPRKVTPEIADFIEDVFFHDKDNSTPNIKDKVKNKFKVTLSAASITSLISTFFFNNKVKPSKISQSKQKQTE